MIVKWIDRYREPQCPPNPEFPEGVDIDHSSPGQKTCRTELPYPAPRCGYWYVECKTCGYNVIITTAGRPDDPRSATLLCMAKPRPRTSEETETLVADIQAKFKRMP